MTTPQASPVPPNATRFLLLVELCRRLGERGCGSYLANPASGGSVLWVERVGRPRDRICVGAVERPDGWVYAWGGQCAEEWGWECLSDGRLRVFFVAED